MTGWIRLAALMLLLALPQGARAEWRQFETRHFTIYSESPDKDVTRLAEGLERIDGLMRMASGLREDVEPVKVRIYQVATNGEVERAVGGDDSGIAGFYDTNILGPFAVTPRRMTFHAGDFTPELVLHHEYAHHFMLQYFPTIYPSWYVEGYAELIGSSTILPDGRVAYGMPAKHRGSEINVDWVSLQDLLLLPPEKIHNMDVYGQGWALAHFFTFSKTRAPQLRQYLAALAQGKSQAEAAKVFGDLGELNREAHRYLAGGVFDYRPVTVPIAQPVIERVTPVSAGEAALIPEVIAFRDDELTLSRKEASRAREQKLRAENLARIREKAARFAGDPFALYFLAQAEYSAGHYAEAEAAADRLLAIQPTHVRGLVTKSLCLSRRAGSLAAPARGEMAAKARQLALRANKADPNDVLPLFAYYESFHLAGEKPIHQAVVSLQQVVATLPHDTRMRQLLVDELAAEHRWADAIAVLMPIANSPHRSPRRDAAREQLAQLQAELAKQGQPAAHG